ncbi:MAG: hypothetical protein ACK5MQ_14950 [Pikeienuella sp.]
MSDGASQVYRHVFAGARRDAPCFDGHFPGAPITPGAVLIAHAARALREAGSPLSRIMRVKFMRPLPPETPFEIEIERRGDMAKLRWISGGELLAQARVALG